MQSIHTSATPPRSKLPNVKMHSVPRYPGVHFIYCKSANDTEEKIYYIRYRKDGKEIKEKAGRQYKDSMTARRASLLRAMRINGSELTNTQRRSKNKELKAKLVWTFDLLWTDYSNCKSNKGMTTDRNRYIKHIHPFFGHREPGSITHIDIETFKNSISGRKPATIRNILELLRRIANYGRRKQLCQGILAEIEMPIVNNQKTEDLSDDELTRLLKVIEEDKDIQIGNMMKLALFTGMRRGSLFKLQWKDIDFEHAVIKLRDAKSGQDEYIPMNETARNILETHPRSGSPFVFPNKHGKMRVCVRKSTARIKKRAGISKDFRGLHGLRHVFATRLASSGNVDLYRIQRLLTHKSPQMTQRYAHLRDDALREACKTMDQIK